MPRIPVACTLTSSGLRDRVGEWANLIRLSARRLSRLDSGVEICFVTDARDELERLADAEQTCCGWATWRVVDDDEAVLLRVTSNDPSGVQVLHELFSDSPRWEARCRGWCGIIEP